MAIRAVAVLLLVCCLALTTEAYYQPQCPYGQQLVGFCNWPWYRCSIGQCYPLNGKVGVCCKKFHGGYY